MQRDRLSTVGPPLAALFFLTGVAACGDGGSTGTDDDEPAVVEIVNNAFSLTQPAETAQLEVTVRNAAGDALSGIEPTYASDDTTVAAVSASGLVQGLGDGEAEVTVSAGSVSATASVTVELDVVALELGEPEAGLDGPPLGHRYYTVEVPPGDEDRVLLIRLKGGTGDADMAIRFGSRPTSSDFDCVSATIPNLADNIEFCATMAPDPGTWHIWMIGFDTYADVTLRATLEPVTPLVAGTPIEELTAAEHEMLFFNLDLPQDGEFDLTVMGGQGDADMFATPDGSVGFNDLSGIPCLSAGPGNDESCTVSPAPAGRWMTFLLAFEAFEGVTLTAEVNGSSDSSD